MFLSSLAITAIVLSLTTLNGTIGTRLTRIRDGRTARRQTAAAAHETISLCPRNLNNVAVYRKCLRSCLTDNDCKGRKKKCLCDGDCGMSCVKPNTKCAPLPDPMNGKVHTTGIEAFGARVFYTCQPEFKLKGLRARSCQGDGTWSGDSPVCHPDVKCLDPPEIPHAQHNADYRHHTYELDTMIAYTCESGYAIDGFARAKCVFFNGTAKWFGPDLRCIPRNCGQPEEITNGYRVGDQFYYPYRISFHCYPGYNLIGKPIRHCQRNGKWDGENPLCKAVECPRPPDPHKGLAIAPVLKYEAVATYRCNPGFQLTRKEERRCLANQTWSGPEPRCEVVNCGRPAPIINGGYNGTQFTFESVVFFYCNKGSTFDGKANSARCNADGNWSHAAPKCFASCIIPHVEHGTMAGNPGDRISHGDLLNVSCIEKYELSDCLAAPRCHNGSFLYVPSCRPTSCKSPPQSPRKGLVIAPKTDHGMKARYVCGKGYAIQGDDTTTCEYGNWTGQPPTCKDIYCSWPGKLANGTVFLVGAMGSYEYYDYIKTVVQDRQIKFECQKGFYLHGTAGATCVDGNWSPPITRDNPICHPGLHPPQSLFGPRLRRAVSKAPCTGLRNENFEQSNVLRDPEDASNFIATFKCRTGFVANIASGTATCRNSSWKPRKPECIPLTCRVPESMNGNFKVDLNRTVQSWTELTDGASIQFSCIAGYQVSGPDRLFCSTGQLIPPTIPECIPASCHLIEITQGNYNGGYRAGLQVSHNSIISYHCVDGYRKSPETAVRCELGQFQPSPPTCILNERLDGRPLKDAFATPATVRQQITEAPRTSGSSLNSACMIYGPVPYLVIYHGNTRLNLSEDAGIVNNLIFTLNAELLFHCEHLGRFQLIGHHRTICTGSGWSEAFPVCLDLLDPPVEYDRLTLPPPILYHKTSGITGIGKTGELLVYPSTDLQLDCVWRRSDGTPSWFASHQFRVYPKAWTAGSDETSDQRYRLSMYHAVRDDSGIFTCMSPRGQANSIIIKVQIVECPLITPFVSHLLANTTATRMGTHVAFNCTKGHRLFGPSRLECLPTGNWSDRTPLCSPVLCPLVNVSETNLRVYGSSRDPGSTMEFACPTGFRLKGTPTTRCEEAGHWSSALPHCEEIICPPPKTPENGSIIKTSTVYTFGDTVEFSCDFGYALIGSSFSTCLDYGRWSDAPQCTPSCNYPGHPANGRVGAPSVLKFHYDVGERIGFSCQTGFTLQGSQNMTCLENGRWSSELPVCVA